ncbi:MAG TPA: hypothetical protein VFL77_07925 [Solirubrobacterales bacterium]|nr:hypothetical protein [Solirubrobacterales bacterium]
MSNKTMPLVLAALSAALIGLPSTAIAAEEDIPVHVVPAPTSTTPINGGGGTLQTVGGTTLTCKEVTGEVTKWESGTTGKVTLTFKNDCTESAFHSSCGEIMTTELQVHGVTLAGKVPGLLITSNEGHFATFTCGGGLLKFVISGNGLIARITSPACGGESNTATIRLEQSGGIQSQKTVEGTATEYHLEASLNGGGKEQAGVSGEGTGTTSEGRKKLECT